MKEMYEQRIVQPHLLIIGRQEADRGLLWEVLQMLDVQMDWVAGGEVAVQRLARGRYALSVVLLPLPHVDGLALCRRLRAADAQQPLLVLHTARPAGDVLAALEAGADAVFVAPIHADELRSCVAALLRRRGGFARVVTPYAVAMPAVSGVPSALPPWPASRSSTAPTSAPRHSHR